eukprot:2492353-Rhodomonas_salina.3
MACTEIGYGAMPIILGGGIKCIPPACAYTVYHSRGVRGLISSDRVWSDGVRCCDLHTYALASQVLTSGYDTTNRTHTEYRAPRKAA